MLNFGKSAPLLTQRFGKDIKGAIESCRTYKVGKNHATGFLALQWTPGKCQHFSIHLMAPVLGLCHLRIPTWLPFRLQFRFNGQDRLERKLREARILSPMKDKPAILCGGCIITAGFPNDTTETHRTDPKLSNLMLAPFITKLLTDFQQNWREVVSVASLAGIPIPAVFFVRQVLVSDPLKPRGLTDSPLNHRKISCQIRAQPFADAFVRFLLALFSFSGGFSLPDGGSGSGRKGTHTA